MVRPASTIPGVYRVDRPRVRAFPRARTDVAGFVGIGGPAHLHEARQLDDWQDYVETYLREADGTVREAPAGSRLAAAVRAFFTNGGARCWVVSVAEEVDASRAAELLRDMLGLLPVVDAEGDEVPTGLELLLRQAEVALVALPDMFAEVAVDEDRTAPPVPVAEEGVFQPCGRIRGGFAGGELPAARRVVAPLFDETQILSIQRMLVERCARQPWRAFVLLSPPPGRDLAGAIAWRDLLGHHQHAALYWPWVRVQEAPGAPVMERSPVGPMSGVFARVDIERGPHAAPANARLLGVVGLATPVDDAHHSRAHERGINVLRAFAGRGVQIWGARTLLYDDPTVGGTQRGMAYVNIRRCLSSIERSVLIVGAPAVFEPNGPILRMQLSQAIWSYLLTVFESGALTGARPEDAFQVRCDSTVNPPELAEDGRLVCEIAVAIGAPAELVVFRLGRREAVVEIEEV